KQPLLIYHSTDDAKVPFLSEPLKY
ncbi:MAG: hypothetical protein QOJ29_3176, partial [Thermoleophilaceae bacterium]|nr:hypothetical protein [Thermoleophilaceae bacterium]